MLVGGCADKTHLQQHVVKNYGLKWIQGGSANSISDSGWTESSAMLFLPSVKHLTSSTT